MVRRGFTLIEILAAMVVFTIVGSMGFYVLSQQNRGWKTESDKTSVQMMAKGSLEDLARAARMTGSGLADGAGGLKVYGSGEEKATFVMNEDGGSGVVLGGVWTPATKRLHLKVDDAQQFAYLGYARLDLKVPPMGAHSATPARTKAYTLGVVDRMTAFSGCGDSIILDGTTLVDSGWTNASDVQLFLSSSIQNIDSITYRKSHDTLFLKRNIQGETIYALGIDTMHLQYYHPVDGWRDSLSGTAPANTVVKVKIRLVLRTRKVDYKLLASNPSSRGYHFSKMETEVGLRTTELLNQ
jgi:prepilin-type N-terminal cleavage/methylation domain-containing protein